MQTSWSSEINPLLKNPVLSGNFLQNISITTGANAINHKLGKTLQGWFVVGIDAPATIYDTQKSNQIPGLTLDLVSSADCIINLYVF